MARYAPPSPKAPPRGVAPRGRTRVIAAGLGRRGGPGPGPGAEPKLVEPMPLGGKTAPPLFQVGEVLPPLVVPRRIPTNVRAGAATRSAEMIAAGFGASPGARPGAVFPTPDLTGGTGARGEPVPDTSLRDQPPLPGTATRTKLPKPLTVGQSIAKPVLPPDGGKLDTGGMPQPRGQTPPAGLGGLARSFGPPPRTRRVRSM
jgi:hypothetical protein